ncbi:MAG: hypothetical protein HW420_663, partial [Candidatus Nitrosotenuis sp.]|nr:hypothetical protein [Candidatus Nitrosotenuis sp.]
CSLFFWSDSDWEPGMYSNKPGFFSITSWSGTTVFRKAGYYIITT